MIDWILTKHQLYWVISIDKGLDETRFDKSYDGILMKSEH